MKDSINQETTRPSKHNFALPKTIERKVKKAVEIHPKDSAYEEKTKALLNSILRTREFDHLTAHSVIQNLKEKKEIWPSLIRHLLPTATRINPQPLIVWKTWRRDCPSTHQELLLSQMRQILGTHPDYRMEKWLNQQST